MRQLKELTPESVLKAHDGDRFVVKNPVTSKMEVLRCMEFKGQGRIVLTRDSCPEGYTMEHARQDLAYEEVIQHLRPVGDCCAMFTRKEFAKLIESGNFRIE